MQLYDLRGRVSDAIIAFGRAVHLLPIVVRFRALRARKRTTKMGTYFAAAGKYQLEVGHRVTRVIMSR